MSFKPITQVFAYLAVENDQEGICGLEIEKGKWMPMVFSDRKIIDKARPVIEQIIEQTGKEIRLVEFTSRSVIEKLS